jgi:hypothetical protein
MIIGLFQVLLRDFFGKALFVHRPGSAPVPIKKKAARRRLAKGK